MSKVADYLRGHITGEVTTRGDVREALSTDLGVLKIKPEIVVYPRTTNDVRKIARFAWQLADKGHVLPITARGTGTGTAGGAIGKGASVVMTAHMNHIFEYDAKQRLVRLQPGVTLAALGQALALQGSGILALAGSHVYGTVGGAIADGVSGLLGGKYGRLENAISKLEVVLANGDILHTERITKRELSKKKGLQTMEGEIYRGVDRVIEDYSDLFDTLRSDDATGYNAIADVKDKDGSIDLTPLFVGSQGTLGIITEMILKTEPRSIEYGVAALVYRSPEDARDALDPLCELKPAFLEYFDARLFDAAATHGKKYDFYETSRGQGEAAVVLLVGFDDFNDRHRAKHLKRVAKIAEKTGAFMVQQTGDNTAEIMSALEVTYFTTLPDNDNVVSPSIFDGFQIPAERFEDFTKGLAELEAKVHTPLPLSGHVYTGVYSVHPALHLTKVGDKQKLFKLLDELAKLVVSYGGTMVSAGGEGRIKSHFVYANTDERLLAMYADIRKVFDPLGTLNPGVKQDTDIRKLAEALSDTHAVGQIARLGLK